MDMQDDLYILGQIIEDFAVSCSFDVFDKFHENTNNVLLYIRDYRDKNTINEDLEEAFNRFSSFLSYGVKYYNKILYEFYNTISANITYDKHNIFKLKKTGKYMLGFNINEDYDVVIGKIGILGFFNNNHLDNPNKPTYDAYLWLNKSKGLYGNSDIFDEYINTIRYIKELARENEEDGAGSYRNMANVYMFKKLHSFLISFAEMLFGVFTYIEGDKNTIWHEEIKFLGHPKIAKLCFVNRYSSDKGFVNIFKGNTYQHRCIMFEYYSGDETKYNLRLG